MTNSCGWSVVGPISGDAWCYQPCTVHSLPPNACMGVMCWCGAEYLSEPLVCELRHLTAGGRAHDMRGLQTRVAAAFLADMGKSPGVCMCVRVCVCGGCVCACV